MIGGIAAYRRHAWHRTLTDPPTIWSEGGTRLLDYGQDNHALPVLFVPSLINRAYVLDLAEGHSMLRWLARQGVRPLLLDWGWPGEVERRFTLTDYVAGRMERASKPRRMPRVNQSYWRATAWAARSRWRRRSADPTSYAASHCWRRRGISTQTIVAMPCKRHATVTVAGARTGVQPDPAGRYAAIAVRSG